MTRFRGHSIPWEGGFHDGEDTTTVPARVSAADGGSITIGASAGGLTFSFDADLRVTGKTGSGGIVTLSAAGPVTMAKLSVDARGDLAAGEVDVSGSEVAAGQGTKFYVKGGGGLLVFEAISGNLTLDGRFRARPDGIIEGRAPSGDLTAAGQFRAAPLGCIGLSAGGTLDTNSATFDVPLLASCLP